MLVLLLTSMFALAFSIQSTKAGAQIWTVDDDRPADFHTIEEAISAANEGDTIYVYSGTYYENYLYNEEELRYQHLIIAKNNLKLIGENRETTIIHATIVGGSGISSTIIDLVLGVSGVVIKGFTFEFPDGGWNNWPILGVGVTNSIIADNIMADSTHGIYLVYFSANIIIKGNIISNVADTGISISTAGGCRIYENIVEGDYGFYIQGSLEQGSDSFYHNNFIAASHPSWIYDPNNVVRNVWDDGYPSGGNYWSDYNSRYPDAAEIDDSGIWDHPYVMETMTGDPNNNKDNYPLINPWTAPPPANDLYWLAKAIMSEASVGTKIEQIAVGWNVLNRLDSGRFGSSIERIVKSGYAYNQEPTENILILAENILERQIPDPTDGATYFFSPRGMPREGEDTTGFDVGGGLQQVPLDGQNIEVYFPSFAEPDEGTVITETTTQYLTAKPTLTKLEWRNLAQIRNWYFMFYRPFTTQIHAEMKSPSELRIYDSQGLVTGLVNGTVVVEIPGSNYFENVATISFPNDTYRYVVAGTLVGLYGLTVAAVTTSENITFSAIDIPTSANVVCEYRINWSVLSQDGEGVTIQEDSDGDGVFEYNFGSDIELTRFEYVAATSGHDLGITKISSKSIVGEGYTLPIDIMIMNYGAYPETFNLTLSANDTLVEAEAVTLPSASSISLNRIWNTIGYVKGNYIINAYAEPVPGETYTADNILVSDHIVLTIQGDINGDKTVDIYDGIILANHYGFDRYRPLWNPNVDLKEDGIIDIFDAIMLAANYGKSWT